MQVVDNKGDGLYNASGNIVLFEAGMWYELPSLKAIKPTPCVKYDGHVVLEASEHKFHQYEGAKIKIDRDGKIRPIKTHVTLEGESMTLLDALDYLQVLVNDAL